MQEAARSVWEGVGTACGGACIGEDETEGEACPYGGGGEERGVRVGEEVGQFAEGAGLPGVEVDVWWGRGGMEVAEAGWGC